MGRDWYRAGSGAKASSSSSASNSTSSKRASLSSSAETTTPTGCISAVFHLFDFHHFHFPLNHHQTTTSTSTSSCSCLSFKQPNSSFLSPHTTLKGTEAPRNSLDSEEEATTSASASTSLTSTTSKQEDNLNIPMGIQIKTSGWSKVNDASSEISSSPGAKTPTLVARLMGLDLLPQTHSPSFSSSTIQQPRAASHLKPILSHRKSLDGDIRGTRSLPETPRISSARRSDVDHHHRFSLQINKEDMSATEESMLSRLKALKKKQLKHEDHENKSPGHYARQIVKQVKESVSRKVGLDITNTTVRNRDQAREELVNHFKNKKISRALTKLAEDHSIPATKHKLILDPKIINLQNHQPPKSSSASEINIQNKPKLQPVAEEQQHKQPPKAISKCKKVKRPQQTSDIIRNKKEEPFVRAFVANRVHIIDKKCKKTPLSNDLLNISVVPTLFPLKKHPSPPATKIPQKQVLDAGKPKRSSQLSSCSSQTYNKQEATYVHISRHDNNIGDTCNDSTTTTTAGEEETAEYHEYIARILRRTGLEKDTPVSLATWFSPSHSLNPSIFYYLEHFTTCNINKTKPSQHLNLRCNRKLMFHLVDEILTDFLKPFMKPWVISRVGREYFSQIDGSRLIDVLCSKIAGFPRADCRVLEDIDALIDKDLPEMKLQSVTAYEEEGEGIVSEIEKGVLDALVHETASDFGLSCAGFNFQRARLSERYGTVCH